jgi:hypothetical protein
MSVHAEPLPEISPIERIGELLRSAFAGLQSSDEADMPAMTRQERLLHAARTACTGTVEW